MLVLVKITNVDKLDVIELRFVVMTQALVVVTKVSLLEDWSLLMMHGYMCAYF